VIAADGKVERYDDWALRKMMNNMIRTTILISLLVLVGCLEFGDDVELSGDEVDASVIAEVERITGVNFPEGTEGLNYFFLGSGVDDALWLKVIIPQEKRTELLKNQIFAHELDEPNHNMTLDRDWWSIQTLNDQTSYSTKINGGTDFLGCTIGTESGRLILYLHWFST
jgi:hypothetical protein